MSTGGSWPRATSALRRARPCATCRPLWRSPGRRVRDVLKSTVYVASSERGDLVAAWDEVAGFFGGHDAPSTLLEVAGLGYPGQLVKIEAIAVTSAR